MDIHSMGEWADLGTELRKRRGGLGYGSRERKRFAADTGLHYRLVQRIETGEREGYPPETIAQVEAAYQLERDAIGAFFTTGRLRTVKAGTDARDEALTAEDAFEEAVMAALLPYAEKAAAVRRHRDQIREQLARLGIDPPPAFFRGGVKHLSGESASNDEARGA